ncbi:MAG: hypothetical protein E7582_01000 [Ruminococcaceae bacterium]|nr:hypothetical protein [Oscillospiraceae bacterium]
MKKIFALLLVFLLCIGTFASCKGEVQAPVTQTENTQLDETIVKSMEYYFARTTAEGFSKYINAFPEEWREGYQALLDYDDETFLSALDFHTQVMQTTIAETYIGCEYVIEYQYKSISDLEDERKSTLIEDLIQNAFLSRESIEDMKEITYDVTTYGVTEQGDKVNEKTVEDNVLLLKIKDKGWYVSPQEFNVN